ncbi:MAG: class I SAM-dependent methyltransferase, partial [Planctomycetota bacterium]
MEHLVDPAAAVENLLGMLESGGRLVLTVPDGREDSVPAGSGSIESGSFSGHIHFWSPESWSIFLRTALG